MKLTSISYITKSAVLVILATFLPCQVHAVSLDSECKPSGILAIGKESWNPKKFWSNQVIEIEEYVANERTTYRLSMIERKRDKINERLDEQEMRAMDIQQQSDPELELLLRKTDKELLQLDRRLLNHAIEWGKKCTAYSKQKLSIISFWPS